MDSPRRRGDFRGADWAAVAGQLLGAKPGADRDCLGRAENDQCGEPAVRCWGKPPARRPVLGQPGCRVDRGLSVVAGGQPGVVPEASLVTVSRDLRTLALKSTMCT